MMEHKTLFKYYFYFKLAACSFYSELKFLFLFLSAGSGGTSISSSPFPLEHSYPLPP